MGKIVPYPPPSGLLFAKIGAHDSFFRTLRRLADICLATHTPSRPPQVRSSISPVANLAIMMTFAYGLGGTLCSLRPLAILYCVPALQCSLDFGEQELLLLNRFIGRIYAITLIIDAGCEFTAFIH